MSLLSVCQNALKEIGGFEVPTSIVGNVNETAVRCFALANRSLKETAKRLNWPDLIVRASFSTVASTEEYSLPSDFKTIVNESMWDDSNNRLVEGPISSEDWEYLKNADVVGGITTYFRIFKSTSDNNRAIYLFPTPDDVRTIRYEYVSNGLVETSGGTLLSDAYVSDTDVSLVDEDIILLGLKWRFLKSHGLPYAEEFRDYEMAIEKGANDTGAPLIDLGYQPPRFQLIVPDGDVGQ